MGVGWVDGGEGVVLVDVDRKCLRVYSGVYRGFEPVYVQFTYTVP